MSIKHYMKLYHHKHLDFAAIFHPKVLHFLSSLQQYFMYLTISNSNRQTDRQTDINA